MLSRSGFKRLVLEVKRPGSLTRQRSKLVGPVGSGATRRAFWLGFYCTLTFPDIASWWFDESSFGEPMSASAPGLALAQHRH